MAEGTDRKLKLSTTPYRELTLASMVFGVLIGCLMTCAFVYIGLKLGFTMGGSTVTAILGFGMLRGVLGSGTIIENNINNNKKSKTYDFFKTIILLR